MSATKETRKKFNYLDMQQAKNGWYILIYETPTQQWTRVKEYVINEISNEN